MIREFFFKEISFFYTHLNVKIVLFQTIQFSISTRLRSIWPIDRTLKRYCASPIVPALLKPHHEIKVIPGHSSYSSAEMQSVYSTPPADWAIRKSSRLAVTVVGEGRLRQMTPPYLLYGPKVKTLNSCYPHREPWQRTIYIYIYIYMHLPTVL